MQLNLNTRFRSSNGWLAILAGVVLLNLAAPVNQPCFGQSANWIWTSAQDAGFAPLGPAHFRKKFQLQQPVAGELIIAADDEFQVYFNETLVGYGSGYDELTKIDLSQHLRDGINLLAIRATNTQGTTAAVSAIMRFRLGDETGWRWLATDETWTSAIEATPPWINLNYDDRRWLPVTRLGVFGTTEPWDATRLSPQSISRQPARLEQSSTAPEFSTAEDFEVQRILDEQVGSIIAMEFNEFGQLILSREGGKILLADLANSGQGEISVRTYCEEIENVQGILPLNGDLFVTGDGPDGMALYRLSDTDRDGLLEPVHTVARFEGPPGEHGPHGITLGPDGMIYVMIGNASGLSEGTDPTSPVRHLHEGEILPRMEDPGGHAAGIRTPGGTIVRISPDGKRRELVAVGLRNAYDLAFNRHGDLFFQDSDMESDVGTPWYRPTQVYHVNEGGEYGWRSGTAKFPAYFPDNLPGIADTGRGSPTGAVVYDHYMMPLRYHGCLFLGDWSGGRILAVRLQENSSSWFAQVEEFLSATPLTVTDLAVGPDGALYFSTGGRGTQGGVYRVAWQGEVPDRFRNLDTQLKKLAGRPQPQAAWTRQDVARLKTEMGDAAWAKSLRGIWQNTANRFDQRIRALEMLTLYGPVPPVSDLISLAHDREPQMRKRIARLLGWRDAEQVKETLLDMLADTDPHVRQAACDSLNRLQIAPDWEAVSVMLNSSRRSEAFAARRLLESMDVESWRDRILEATESGTFVQGGTALMVVDPDLQNAYAVLARASQMMEEPRNTRQWLELLRVAQLALAAGEIDPRRIPLFNERILELFPADNGLVNRELSRIIGYLKLNRIGEQLPDYLARHTDSAMDKLQVLMNLRDLAGQFDGDANMAAIVFLEEMQTSARAVREGNYNLFMAGILQSYTGQIADDRIPAILANGSRWPSAALVAFYRLPENLDEPQVQQVIEIDRQLKGRTETPARQARLGCLAVLGRSGDDQSMSYLREVWRHEPDRRDHVTLALAQQPDGPNWPYLISSLGQVSDDTTREVLSSLATVNKRPSEPSFLRQTILAGYRLRQDGVELTDQLLNHWTGNLVDGEGHDWRVIMESWAKWFNQEYPDQQPVKFEDESAVGKYSVDQILSWIENDPATPRMHNGMLAFTRAQCATCHRFNGQGDSIGPDLSTIARRFSKRETLRAILHPSEVISDQFSSTKVITTDGRQLIGLLGHAGGNQVLLQSDGNKITLAAGEIEETAPATTSAMPEGLIDELSLEDIRDLLAYLYQGDTKMAGQDRDPDTPR